VFIRLQTFRDRTKKKKKKKKKTFEPELTNGRVFFPFFFFFSDASLEIAISSPSTSPLLEFGRVNLMLISTIWLSENALERT